MRIVIVSNRAPVSIVRNNDGTYSYMESSGGLASGLRAYVERMKKEDLSGMEILWIGWPGCTVEDKEAVGREIREKFGVHSVFLEIDVMERFYAGFCNKTIWPLFHYFPMYTIYEKENWEHYILVNKIFCKTVLEVLREDDVIWIHDYHLLLLPSMVREQMPSATIGFFLHVPFPSYEVFRLLPSEWRKHLLEGLYGADLIGFHTHDYCTYFLRSSLRILGLEQHMGEVLYNDRLVKTDTFPMGIDFEKFHAAIGLPEVQEEINKLKKNLPAVKLILSIDRQDYSKGILNRLQGYDHFLQNNPQWMGKVSMMMVVIPSRIGVQNYQDIKSHIDEMAGKINGKYGRIEWMPIVYQYRSLAFPELVALYNSSAIALITPLRDGMNLIAKEYIASRDDNGGVIILSEMAGAVDEISETIVVNPNNMEEISHSLLRGLEMDKEEQERRMKIMQKRVKNYDVFAWAGDFLHTLNRIKQKQQRMNARIPNAEVRKKIISGFRNASSRILFLDYDGTLSPHASDPLTVIPAVELLGTVEKLLAQENTSVVIISGRDKSTLDRWFGHLPVMLAAEHGLYVRKNNKTWKLLKPVRKNWKKKITPLLIEFVARLPGSLVEEKEYSIVFHYRRCDPALAAVRIKELMDYLGSFISNMDVQLFNSSKALEVRNAGIDKGVAALYWMSKTGKKPDFVFSAGDDLTDEDMFRVMPEGAFSIRVGSGTTYAKYSLRNPSEVTRLLLDLCE